MNEDFQRLKIGRDKRGMMRQLECEIFDWR